MIEADEHIVLKPRYTVPVKKAYRVVLDFENKHYYVDNPHLIDPTYQN